MNAEAVAEPRTWLLPFTFTTRQFELSESDPKTVEGESEVEVARKPELLLLPMVRGAILPIIFMEGSGFILRLVRVTLFLLLPLLQLFLIILYSCDIPPYLDYNYNMCW